MAVCSSPGIEERSKSCGKGFSSQDDDVNVSVLSERLLDCPGSNEIYYSAKEASLVRSLSYFMACRRSLLFTGNKGRQLSGMLRELSLRHDVITVSCLFKLP